MRTFLFIIATVFVSGCTGIPEDISPVNGFDSNRYLGKWYEIARLDHSFERGLNNVTAEYTLRDDGGLTVINKGFSTSDNKWQQAQGKAYFVSEQTQGHLKVSFFGPFYSSYIVFGLDKANYQYAFVAGYSKSYLWLLSRTPTVNEELIERFVKEAKALGFDTEQLIFVKHSAPG